MAGESFGESTSSGQSSGGSQSTSVPTSVTSAQTDWGLQQSQLLSMLADRTYNWAMDQYAKGNAVTDQTVQNFMEMSGKGKGLADTLMHQYQDQIKPLIDKYIQDAASYASEGRQRFEAGKAESTVAQADKSAMDALERKLEGTGVNVNSGRIQEQMIASRMQDAAARVGAGTKAAQDTEKQGREMEEKAIAMGQQMPGQAINAVQSSYAGLTGAENAILALLNTGKNLAEAAAPYEQAAVAANKIPPTGQNQQSTSAQQSTQGSQSQQGSQQRDPEGKGGGEKQPKEPGQGKGGGQGGGQGEGQGGKGMGVRGTSQYGATYNVPQTGGTKKDDDQGTGAPDPLEGYMGPIGYVDSSGTVMPEFSPEAGTTTWDQANANPLENWTGPDTSQGFNVDQGAAGADNPQLGGAQIGTPWNDALTNTPNAPNPSYPDEYQASPGVGANAADAFGGQNFQQYAGGDNLASDATEYQPYQQDFSNYDQYDQGTYPDQNQTDNSTYDAGNDYSDWTDAGSSDNTDYSNDSYNAGDNTSDFTDAGNQDNTDYSSYDSGAGYDNTDYSSQDNTDYSSQDYSGADYGGDYGGYDEYARGGRVRPRPGVLPTTGGAVSRGMSPSRGRQTDDISARLNAGEYVIPRDVVSHKGTEFFTKLIQNSRKLRTGMAGAKPGPTMRPALPQGRPAFQSRALPPR